MCQNSSGQLPEEPLSTPRKVSNPSTSTTVDQSKLWASPLAPQDSAAWPDSRSKLYWIGPFDLARGSFARAASNDASPEPHNIQELRITADVYQKHGRYIESRFCWSSIADQYISEKEHTPQWTGEYPARQDKLDSLKHKIKIAIGGILNTYFAQFPDLSDIAGNEGEDCFYRVIEKERGYEEALVLYTTRILLYYCLRILYQPDKEWLCKVYRQALEIAEPVHGSKNSDVINLLQDMALAVESQEMSHFWEDLNKETCGMDGEQKEEYQTQKNTRCRREAMDLLQRASSVLQQLHGPSNPLSLNCAYELAMLYMRAGKLQDAELL
ncbi:hypothetical protein MMC17_007714 [Xylographa soralifera]|nr:hypothetical protein [Xylographa soralifera]